MERLAVADFFDRVALGMGEREALVFPDARIRWRDRERHAHVSQVAKGLMGIGVDAGDHVALLATNRVEWVVLQLAVAKVGAVLVPIEPRTGVAALAHVLAHSDASTLFVVDRADDVNVCDLFLEAVPEARASRPGRLASRRVPALKRVIALGPDAPPPGLLAWSDVLGAGAGISDHLLRRRQDAVQADDVAAIHYTAGTTGPPKGVELVHWTLVSDAIAAGDGMRLGRTDRVCVAVPFARASGSVLGVLGTLGRGATMVVPAEQFDAGQTLAAIATERCTALHAEPRMLASLLRHPSVLRTNVSSLRTGIVLGAPCPVGLVAESVARLHLPELTVGYGQTETTAVITLTRPDDPLDLRATTVGRALPEIEVRIVDPRSSADVPAGAEGELCCRGHAVMRGYYKDPDATAAVLGANGWLRTGDLAVMDRFGYCTITGRARG